MLKPFQATIEEIYVPTKWKKTLEPEKVDTLAESILEDGQKTPIHIRQGDGRYVLVSGYHRLEAMKALGEEQIEAIVVGSKKF